MQEKILGVIYGTAIGDALGWPVEFDKTVYPSKPKVFADSVPRQYTDDTQMFRAVVEGLLRWSSPNWPASERMGKNALDSAAEEVAEEFIAWSRSPENNRAPGGSCMAGCRNLEAGVHWRKSGVDSGGCGTAMRSMAYGLFISDPVEAGRWAAEHALMTHTQRCAQAAAAAVAAGVAVGMKSERHNAGDVLMAMLEESKRWDDYTNNMLCEAAQSSDKSADIILDRWRGWAGHEAVAASLWCFLRHHGDFESAVLTAVNSPGDSDSLGAITGALMGARVGISGIPKHWVQQVEDSAGLEVLAHRVCKRLGL